MGLDRPEMPLLGPASYQKLDGDVQRILGTARYEQYRGSLNRRFEALLLAPRKPRG